MTPQLASDGRLRHLLTLEGLPRSTLLQLLDRAGQIRDAAVGRVGKRTVLAGSAVCTLFFEPSTRTRSSFQLAAQRLGADVLNFDASTSSTRKGETARDTLKNLEAMGVRGFVIRHPEDGAVQRLADVAGAGTALVGDGPTVAARVQEYADLGIDTFIFSGYPHLEESYRVAELLFPHLDIERPELPKGASYVSPFGEMVANDILPKAASQS